MIEAELLGLRWDEALTRAIGARDEARKNLAEARAQWKDCSDERKELRAQLATANEENSLMRSREAEAYRFAHKTAEELEQVKAECAAMKAAIGSALRVLEEEDGHCVAGWAGCRLCHIVAALRPFVAGEK